MPTSNKREEKHTRKEMGDNDDHNDGDEAQWSCCNDSQSLFILLYMAYVLLALITWNTLLAKPMRLVAVFIHEWSHAVACWLTCGEVREIEVHDNEGGVTRYVGGCRCLIIPAGYVGCGFVAMIFVILSGGRKTATFAAVSFTLALLLSLCYSPNLLLFYLNWGYALLTIGCIYLEYWVYTPILQFLILFYGVFLGIFAIADIHADTVAREVKGSDAYACSEEVCPGCTPRCVGIQWAILAICFQLFGIWIALVEMSEECEDLGWFECIHLSIDWDMEVFDKNWDFDGFWDNEGLNWGK
jgi:hypothetical protein